MSLPFENSHFFVTKGAYPQTEASEWRPISKEIKVHFRIWPCNTTSTDGPLQILLFNHGFLGNSSNFRKLYTPLQQNPNIYGMIALDCPGFGYSDRGTKILHHDRERANVLWETVLHATQECFNININEKAVQFTIIGHSMGARTTAAMVHYANNWKADVRNVILIGGAASYAYMNKIQGKSDRSLKTMGFFVNLPGAKTLLRWTSKLVATKSSVRKILLKEYKMEPTEEEINFYLAPLLIQGTFEGLVDMSKLISSGDEFAEEHVEQMTAWNHQLNVLLIYGANDETISPQVSEALKTELERVKILSSQKIETYKIDNAGHLPMESKPELVLQAMVSFLWEQKK